MTPPHRRTPTDRRSTDRRSTDRAPTDALTDRAEALLDATPQVALSLPELAGLLDTSTAALAAQLEGDDRFVLIQPTTFPDLSLLAEADRAAYGAALQEAGVHAAPSVALRTPADPGADCSLDLLLRNSVARLLALAPAEGLIAVTERMRMAVGEAIATTDDPAGTAPSTTPPPDPLAPGSALPRSRHRPRRRPPYPGSRRG